MIGQMLGLSQEDMANLSGSFTAAVMMLERAVLALEKIAECQEGLLQATVLSYPEPDEPDPSDLIERLEVIEPDSTAQDFATNYDVVNYDEGDESP